MAAVTEIYSKTLDGVKEIRHEYATRFIQWVVGASIDGIFGNETKIRVQNWRASHGLTPDGVVGPATWAKMLG
ncbi:MAG: peptidoglycan-binding protein [Clostridium sp.]|uniref:peptidoglycan-binding domain-containing protein n=1 Tax=Clostridium sp. TaxID=1506 RepID=UPI0039EC5D11